MCYSKGIVIYLVSRLAPFDTWDMGGNCRVLGCVNFDEGIVQWRSLTCVCIVSF